MAKAFSWSYSKMKDWEQCKRAYDAKYVTKSVKFEDTPQSVRGKYIHRSLDSRAVGVPLPAELAYLEKYGKAFDAARKAGKEIMTEQQLAFDRDLKPVEWYDGNTWVRVIVDAAVLDTHAGMIIDWKTGKPREDKTQLDLNACAVFLTKPSLQTIDTRFVWLPDPVFNQPGAPAMTQTVKRSDTRDIWLQLRRRADEMERGIYAEDFRPTKSGLCKQHCPVTKCEFNGKRTT